MLTLFTLPKPFIGHIGVIQRNAIRSWTRLHPEVEVLLFGNEEGTAELAAELGLRHFPEVGVNEYGTPFLRSYFQVAEDAARNPLMCYVNADIILFPDLLDAVAKVNLDHFMMGGRRTDLDVVDPIDFSQNDWAEQLHEEVRVKGELRGFSAIDYFVYPKGFWGELPPLILGRWYWDNWLVYRARRLGGAMIDASPVVTIVHQNHDYRHIPGVQTKGSGHIQGSIEAFANRRQITSIMMTLEDADWKLDPDGLSRNFHWTRWHILNEIALQAEIHDYPAWLRKPAVWIARQQWDRNWRRRYASLLADHPEFLAETGPQLF